VAVADFVAPTGSSGVVEMGGGGIGRLAATLGRGLGAAVIFLGGAGFELRLTGFRGADRGVFTDRVARDGAGRVLVVVRRDFCLLGGVRTIRWLVPTVRPAGAGRVVVLLKGICGRGMVGCRTRGTVGAGPSELSTP
jgi:hypothetical protein